MKTSARKTTGDPNAMAPLSSVNLNLNSLLSGIMLLVVGWIGMKTATNSDALIEIKTSQPYITQTVSELKNQLASLVSRSEFDSRLSEAKQERVTLESRIHTLEIMLKEIPGKQPSK